MLLRYRISFEDASGMLLGYRIGFEDASGMLQGYRTEPEDSARVFTEIQERLSLLKNKMGQV